MFQSRFLEPSGYWTSHSDSNQSLFLSDFFLLLYSPHFESCFPRPIFDSLQGSEKSFFCFVFFFLMPQKLGLFVKMKTISQALLMFIEFL